MSLQGKTDIAILGTRGIPANYSGFETCVEETAKYFVANGLAVRVYCREGKVGSDVTRTWRIKRVFLPFARGKHFETITHTFLSVVHLVFNPATTVHLYGAGNGWFVPVLRFLSTRIVFLCDGLDWDRMKWGWFAKCFLRLGARIGSKFAHKTVVDSKHVLRVLQGTLHRRNLFYVPYGAKIIHNKTRAKLDQLSLAERDYFLFVGRFVPEKNVALLVEAFEQAATSKKLVLVGGASYDTVYEKKIRSTNCERVVFPGFVYGEAYEELLCHCYVYIQPSNLEGTSPSLLAAMGAGACVLASNIPENMETVGNAGFFFVSNAVQDLVRMLEYLDKNPEEVAAKGAEARKRVQSEYSWTSVGKALAYLSAV